MITFKTPEFDVHIRANKIAFLSKEPLVQKYIVGLMTGVGMPCFGTPTYEEMMDMLMEAGSHARVKTPSGLDTCVNLDFLFLTSTGVNQTSVVYPNANCVIAVSLDEAKQALRCI